MMAIFHLEGHAQLCYKLLYDVEKLCPEEFFDKVYVRFGRLH